MSRLCLDTSAYSRFKRGDPKAVRLIDGAAWVGIPVVVLGELRAGFALGAKAAANERELAAFMRTPVVSVLDIDEEVSRIYAGIVVALREARTPLPTNDIWIAAVAAREGATVLTYDSHFAAIHRVGTMLLSTDA